MADTRVYDELGNVISGTYDDTPSPPPAPNQSDAETARLKRQSAPIVSKTVVKSNKPPKVVQSKSQNVLNHYRSFTYNFTLAALKKDDVNDPAKYRNSALDYVIAKSGGKGTTGITVPGDLASKKSAANNRYQQEATSMSATAESLASAKKTLDTDLSRLSSTPGLVNGFNANSPGRFDMFIDHVEIESIMGFSEDSNTSLPTGIKFEIIEPYSINGFIESIQVAAVAAGYPSYATASFLLKMDFIGYPDSSDFPDPEIVQDSTRYFVFGFTGLEVDVTEKGTKYRCAGVPFNEKGFGNPNKLKKPTNMAGNTVREILEDLIKNVNEQVVEADKASKNTLNKDKHDQYAIKFMDWDDSLGFVENRENEIAKSPVSELLKDNALYKFNDPAKDTKPNAMKADKTTQPSAQEQAKDPEAIKYAPKTPQVQFSDGANIHECIASLIRDSKYVRNILSTIGQTGNPDEYGMVKYFLIKIEVENLNVIDEITRKPFQKFTYVVSPYRVHYTRIPNYGTSKIDASTLNLLSLREYNYVYTGKNIDVMNFKLNFNTLFFEAIPNAMGNTDSPGDGLAKNNSVEVKTVGGSDQSKSSDQNALSTLRADPKATEVHRTGPNAGQLSDDPYSILARNMHDAIINSKASMITGEIEILGDPFFLVTGGIGNYNPKPGTRGKTVDGEAAHNYSEVLITVNFRNPIDIDTFENGGQVYFDTKKVPFSGVYRVNKVNSSFKEGQFKQTLEILRVPGQLELGSNESPSDPSKRQEQLPNPLTAVVTDTTEATNAGSRASGANLLTQLGRGLPSPGLPGALSNFIGQAGGLGGTVNGLLNQVSGAVSGGLGQLTAASAVFGSIPGGVDQLASGIRLQTSGLLTSAQSALGSAASLGQIGNTLQNSFPFTNAASDMASNIVSKANAARSLIGVAGSGIGDGATIKLDTTAAATGLTTAATDLFSQTAKLPTNITSLSGLASSVSTDALAAVTGLGSGASALAGGIGDKLKSLTAGLPNDPSALASKFGINPAQLSGLSGDLKSKVIDQMAALSKSIPSNTDLSAIASQGIVLDYISTDKLANLPASQPVATAPAAPIDQAFLSELVKNKGPKALAAAFGVSDISKIPGNILPASAASDILSASSIPSNPLSKLTSQLNSIDLSSLGGKLASAGSQLSGITGAVNSVEGALGSIKSTLGDVPNLGGNLASAVTSKFGSLTQGNSPLDKIMKG
jgi:hypothetical protein